MENFNLINFILVACYFKNYDWRKILEIDILILEDKLIAHSKTMVISEFRLQIMGTENIQEVHIDKLEKYYMELTGLDSYSFDTFKDDFKLLKATIFEK